MLYLDDLDMRIIRELGGSKPPLWNIRESYSNISRKVGVDEETIRLRVNRARDRGFLPRWLMIVNPLLIGCNEANLDLEVKDEQNKVDAISKIKTVDGVYRIDDFRGREILVGIYNEDDESLARTVESIESICESQRLALWDTPFIRPDVQMKPLDWRIICAMRDDAWRDLDDVARSLGVSARTIQRRLTAMKEGRAVYLARPPNVNAVSGLMCSFLVYSDPDKKRAADFVVHSTFNRIGVSDTSNERFSVFGISCENFSEVDKVTERLRAIDGVKSVRMRIVKDIIVVQDWIRAQIAQRLPDAQG